VRLLRPFGISDDLGATLSEFWSFASKGDRTVAWFTEFASLDPGTRGHAIGRTAHIINLAIKELCRDHWRSLLDSNIYDELKQEMQVILTWLELLAADEDASTSISSSSSVHMTSMSGVEEAAKRLYAYLASEGSILRMVLSTLSSGGLIYSACMADRIAEAAINRKGGDLDEADFVSAVSSMSKMQELTRGQLYG
jgi:hypothetical protein